MTAKIHPAQAKKAEKMGVTLEPQAQFVRAFWPMRNLAVFGTDARWAIEQMTAAQKLVRMAEGDGHDIMLAPTVENPLECTIALDNERVPGAKTPMVWNNDLEWYTNGADKEPTIDSRDRQDEIKAGAKPVEFQEDQPPTKNGVPTHGLWAFAKGFTAADCPFDEGTAEFDDWNTQFDDAADKAVQEKTDEEKFQPHSVVKHKFRAKYAEEGHPSNCGDELAVKLNQLVIHGGKTDMGMFETICGLNGVDTSKYSHTSKGWEGRLRMTGRNMLAKVVFKNGGVMLVPEMAGGKVQMSAEWMAAQRFK